MAEKVSNEEKDLKTFKHFISKFKYSLKKLSIYGYILAIFSGISFTLSNFFVQVTLASQKSQPISPLEIVLARNVVQLIVISPLAFSMKIKMVVPREDYLLAICMSLFGVFNIVVTYLSLEKIPLADTLVITFTSPVFAALFSFFILRERLHILDGIVGLFSFVGVIVVARPTYIFGPSKDKQVLFFQAKTIKKANREWTYLTGIIYALLGGIFLSLYFVTTRKMSKSHHSFLSIIYTSATGVIVTPLLIFIFIEDVVLPKSILSLVYLVSVGLCSSGALVFLTLALKYEEAFIVSLIRNIDMVYAFLLQYFVFNVKPSSYSMIGGSIIIATTSFICVRKSKGWFEYKNYKPLINDKT